MPTPQQITDACNKITKQFLDSESIKFIVKGKKPHPYDINCGLCDEFVHDVTKLLGGETDDFYGIWLDQLGEDACHCVIRLKVNDKWLYFDAECPQGTYNIEEIPVIANKDKTRKQVVGNYYE